MDEDLDAQLRRTDPDRWLSSRFIADPMKRADVAALYAYDGELARAPRVASSPLLGEMRLTWWREALEEIYAAGPVRRHPVALALDVAVKRRAIPREPLETMIDARYAELPGEPKDPLSWAQETAGTAAQLVVTMLDPDAEAGLAIAAGAAWALGRRGDAAPALLAQARADASRLSVAAFPAVAHAALVGHTGSELSKRLRLMWAVARGRI